MNPKKKIPLGTVIYVSIFLFLMSWAIFEIIKRNRPSINSFSKPINPEHFMSFQQQQEADLIIDIDSWEKIILSKPKQVKIGSSILRHFTRDQFPQVMTENDIGRYLALVIMGAGTLPREYTDYETAFEDMEKFLLEQGFQRVVILENGGHLIPAGYYILRDSEKKQNEVLK